MKLQKTFFLLILVGILFSCGKDGDPGSSYVSLDWDFYVDAYTDNNPSIPTRITKNFDYSSEVGNYRGAYLCSDASGKEWFWEFTYKTARNDGKDRKIFLDGDDGKNKHFKIYLHGLVNASITVTDKLIEQTNKQTKSEIPRKSFDFTNKTKKYIGDEIVNTFVQENTIITMKRRMFIVE